jgi:hypothetical protein
MTYLVFNEEHYCTDSYHSPEQWGEWYESYSFVAPTLAFASEGDYGSFPYVGRDLQVNDELFVLYAVWSSGDSFGEGARGLYEFLCVNKDADMAVRNLEKVKACTDFSHIELELDDGSLMKCYCGSWLGYFESLDVLDLARVKYMGHKN